MWPAGGPPGPGVAEREIRFALHFSSITTVPFKPARAVCGASSRARLLGSSRPKTCSVFSDWAKVVHDPVAALPEPKECRDRRTAEFAPKGLQLPWTRKVTHGGTIA